MASTNSHGRARKERETEKGKKSLDMRHVRLTTE